MAAIGAATHSSLTLAAARRDCVKAFQQSFFCRGSKRRASVSLLAGHCSKYPVGPTCRLRSRNARASNRKTEAKKVSRGRRFVAPQTTSEDNKEGHELIAEVDINHTIDDVAEQVGSVNNVASPMVLEEDEQKPNEAEATDPLTSESLRESGTNSDEESFIHRVEDLMYKVRDAERSILTLNEAQLQNLEKLEQARCDNESLRGQVNVLQMRLAEAEAKLKLASQEKVKVKLLEEELAVFQAKLSKDSEAEAVIAQLNIDYNKLSEHSKILQERVDKLDSKEAELEQLKKEKEALQEEIRSLRLNSADLSLNNRLINQLQIEKESLQSIASELKLKLDAAESNLLELAKLRSEKQTILEKFQKMETDGPVTLTSKYTVGLNPSENQALHEKVSDLQVALAELEAENELLSQAQAENKLLRDQINMLEQRLIESDAEIRSQLELYQAEVETFQASLEQLKLERATMLDDYTVDDMPWDFWSHLLLCLDGWMLEKKLSPEDATTLREMAWRRDFRIKDTFIAKKGEPDHDIISGLLELLKAKKRPGMHIVHIAAEMAPVAKVGGLGDVVTGLGKALQRKGHLIEVILPKYDCIDYSRINNLKLLNLDLCSYFDGHTFKNKIWLGTVEGLPVYFIEPHHPAKFFWRGQVYGENDDFRRFTYFCRAALEFVIQANKRPDIIHCHDWHTAAVAPLYWDLYVPEGLDSARVAFTCHNFEYQGAENAGALASCGLNPQELHRPDRMQDNVVHNRINLLKGGIVFSNIVTTVSPTYSQEVLGPEGGKGLHSTLMAHSNKFFGILNGIDTEAWNPASDALIDHQYSAEDVAGKAANKAALRARLGLSAIGVDLERPLVGCITRLVPQKGVHLIRHAIYRTLEQGGQFVLLGSSPIRDIQSEFEKIAHQFSHHPHIRLILKYDETLSHLIYAAADMFIIPSIFEPCGLTQLISMRYGAIPVARKTGGLNDSVFDVDDDTIPLQRRNGFTFSGVDEQSLNNALDRALRYFVKKPEWWKELAKRAMQMDFSWNSSADQYEELYQMAITRARSRTTN